MIIDTQYGMYSGKRIDPIYQGEQKIKKIKNLLEKAREKSLTIIYIKHLGGMEHPLEENTEGCDIHYKISPTKKDVIITKKNSDSFLNTELYETLLKLSVSKLYIVGNQTEYCVDTTCRSAFSKGFQVLLIKDCHSTWNTDTLSATQIIEHHNKTLEEDFVILKNSGEISFEEFN